MRWLLVGLMVGLAMACAPRDEGMSPGDCSDGADNDGDGDFDCDDSGCAGAPACEVEDTDTDTDTDTDSDTDTDTDTDTDSDTDSDTDTDTDTDTDSDTGPVDADEDGYSVDEDCDDTDPDVNPGATEVCGNFKDDDCDGDPDGCLFSGESVLGGDGFVLKGDKPYDATGIALSVTGDHNGDGVADILVGAPWRRVAEGNEGVVWLLDGPVTTDTSLDDGLEFEGTAQDANLGGAVAFAGDLNGDGYDDVAMAQASGWGESAPGGRGEVAVFAGPVTDPGRTFDPIADATTVYTGDAEKHGLGRALAAVGDTDGDGKMELAIGAPFARLDGNDGRVYLVEGLGSGGKIESTADHIISSVGDMRIGRAIHSRVDMDGDGKDDLLLTGHLGNANAGGALLFNGKLSGNFNTSDADVRIEGEGIQPKLGMGDQGVAVGDFDGDGALDLALGAYDNGTDGPGRVHIFDSGDLTGTVKMSDAVAVLEGEANDEAGWALISPGDVDLDGNDDLFVGAWKGAGRFGATYLVQGPFSGTSTLDDVAEASWYGRERDDRAGQALGWGYIQGDGSGALLIAAPLDTGDVGDAGALYVLTGGW